MGTLAFSGPRWSHYAPLHSDFSVGSPPAPLVCRGPTWKNEKEGLSRAQSRLNQKEKESCESLGLRQTAASVPGSDPCCFHPLLRKTLQRGGHPSGRSSLPRAPFLLQRDLQTLQGPLAPSPSLSLLIHPAMDQHKLRYRYSWEYMKTLQRVRTLV